MTLFTVFYAIMKKEVLTPCLGPAAFWVWNFSAVPVLGDPREPESTRRRVDPEMNNCLRVAMSRGAREKKKSGATPVF